MQTRTSTALLIAWFVLIAGLVGVIAFFTLRSQAPAPTDSPVKPIAPVKGPVKPTAPGATARGPGSTGHRPNPPAPRQLAIEGSVHATGGAPVEGAHVAIFLPGHPGSTGKSPAASADFEERRTVSLLVYISPEEADLPRKLSSWTAPPVDEVAAIANEIASATTDDKGNFKIDIPAGTGSAAFRLTASKDGVGSASNPEVKPGERVDLTLGAAAQVKGTVIAEVGSAPVPNANVVFDSGARRFAAVTDAEGHFAIDSLGPGFYQLSVAAEGRTPLFDGHFKIIAQDTTPITLRMPRGTTLRVKATVDKPDTAVTGARGKQPETDPVPNALVVVYSEDTYAYVMGTTNAEGVVEFPGMPGGKYVMNGKAAGVVSSGECPITIDKNQLVQEETVSFEPAVDTPVTVVDEDGRPVAGVEFYCGNADEKYDAVLSVKIGATDGDGKMKFAFEFDGPRCAIFGFKPGYTVVRACPDDYQGGDPIRLVAKKPVRVKGLVRNADGQAIPDAVVTITVSSSQPEALDDVELAIRADKDGRYDFPYLPRTDDINIEASTPDGMSRQDEDLEVVAGKDEYTLDITIEMDDATADAAAAPKTPPAPAPGDGKQK
jgi:protocatechuate 3,4-dioxygenase beta subunit